MNWLGAQRELFERYRTFAEREVSPWVVKNDAAQHFDRELWKRIGASGLFSLHVPKSFGGAGLSLNDFAAALEGFSTGAGDLGLSVSIVAHAGCVIPSLLNFATETQLKHWLPKLMSGEWLAGIANSESRSGTDVMAMRSKAVAATNGFTLTSRKRSITNVGSADFVMVSAKIASENNELRVSVLGVTPQERVWQRPSTELMGLRTSATGSFIARKAQLPSDSLIGKIGDGTRLFRTQFALERLLIGSLFLATIDRCLERAVHHAENRTAFGDAIGRNQYVQEKIVRMRISSELLSAHLERTRAQFLAGSDVSAALSIIKSWGAEAAAQATEDLVSLLGGRGMLKSHRAEKDFRDVFGLSILGGTHELQKIVIYRETVKSLKAAAGTEAAVDIDQKHFRDIDRSLENALIALVARAFPGEESVAGRYYYDTPPDSVVLARVSNRLVGFRMICRREVNVGQHTLRIAGIGIGVDPEFQHQGIGRALTAETLSLLQAQGDELAVAFLVNRNAEALLTGFGFRKLNAEVSYTHRQSGKRVVETMPCFVRDLSERGDVIEKIESEKTLFLGLGTW